MRTLLIAAFLSSHALAIDFVQRRIHVKAGDGKTITLIQHGKKFSNFMAHKEELVLDNGATVNAGLHIDYSNLARKISLEMGTKQKVHAAELRKSALEQLEQHYNFGADTLVENFEVLENGDVILSYLIQRPGQEAKALDELPQVILMRTGELKVVQEAKNSRHEEELLVTEVSKLLQKSITKHITTIQNAERKTIDHFVGEDLLKHIERTAAHQ